MTTVAPFRGEVYIHTCVANEKSYVGQTTQGMEKRWDLHLRCANSPRTPAYSTLIGRAIRKYGADAFEHRVLAIACSQEQLDNLERIWITLLQTKLPNGYNMSDGGYAAAGHIVTPEVRAVLSAAAKKQWQNPEFREQYSESRRGWKPSPKHIAAVVAAHIGKKQSSETVAKRIAKTTGMKRSLEARSKMSVSHTGLPWSAVRRAAWERGRNNG
jgi:group I intron endonuclease